MKREWNFSLHVVEFKEDGVCYVYAPSLDVWGYGNDRKKAKASFEAALEFSLEYMMEKGTLLEELKQLGWRHVGAAKQKMAPPRVDHLIADNERLRKTLNENESVRMERLRTAIPFHVA